MVLVILVESCFPEQLTGSKCLKCLKVPLCQCRTHLSVAWHSNGALVFDNSTSPLFRAGTLRFCEARDSVTRYQFVNVEDFEGRGESQPTPYFYQNLGEAEYCVALFMYMHLGLLRQVVFIVFRSFYSLKMK